MDGAKVTAVKLMLCFFCAFGADQILLTSDCLPAEKYVVQVAASKTPINIRLFAKKYFIADSITEIQSVDWYRYVVGNFKSYQEASAYAIIIGEKTGISGAFARKTEESNVVLNGRTNSETGGATADRDKNITPIDSVGASDSMQTKVGPSEVAAQPEIIKPVEKVKGLFLKIIGNKDRSMLEKRLAELRKNQSPSFFQKYSIRVIEKCLAYPIILFLVFLILVFIVNVIAVLLILYYSNRAKNHKERYIRVYRKIYEEALLSYLFGDADWEKTRIKLKRIKKPLNREILVSILFSFQENLRGEIDKEIPGIFVKLGLHRNALKLAKSKAYFNKITGIRELTYLYSKGGLEIIPDYLNDPDDLVRAEAQTSYVRLHKENPFGFFGTLSKPFTRWTQLTAFHLFRLYNLQATSFGEYLNSEHTNIRNFSLQMIIYFQQLENASGIFKMLESKEELTRFLAIKAINDLRLYYGKDLIKSIYPTETGKNRVEIIKALLNIGGTEDFDFLESIIRSGSVSAKTEACRSLYFMNGPGRERLLSLNSDAGLEIELYIAHVTDPRN